VNGFCSTIKLEHGGGLGNTSLTGGVPTEIAPVKTTLKTQKTTEGTQHTIPDVTEVVSEGIFAHGTLAASADYLGLKRVTLPSVLFIIIKSIHNLTVYNISDHVLAH
jgi:hypothetical protein